MKKARLLITSCLWLTAFGTPVWGADADRAPAALVLRPAMSSLEEPNSSLHLSVEDFRSAPFQEFFSPAFDEAGTALPGLQARYQMGLADHSLELSGGYVPGLKGAVPSESRLDPDAYLGYVNLKIPLHRFYLKGGAFFGQNMDALPLMAQSPWDERGPQRSLFGYQVGGGYKFSDTLSIQAGWGQAAQGQEISREDLRTWYIQAQISLGWRVSITPQVGYVDFTNGDGEKTKAEAFYCGARWQINF